jgi:6-phosphogluconolactonase
VLIYVGSYTAEADGDGTGISVWGTDGRPAAPTVPLTAPSFLTAHPTRPALYAVGEVDDGSVASLAAAADGSLTVTARQSTRGSQPCHLSITADGRYLLVANYGSGSVAVLAVDSDGTVGTCTDLVQHTGCGPEADRQDGPHTHEVVVDGDAVTAVDLGTDTIYGYRLDPAGRLGAAWSTHAGAGVGPRHLVAAPDGRRYVTDELGSTVSVYAPDPAGLRLVHRVPATLREPAGRNYPSGIALSADGRFVYVANRGNDSLTTFAVDGDRLAPVDEIGSGGTWPRDLTRHGELIYVPNQRSHTVGVFRVTGGTGAPRDTGERLEVPSPACVLVRD